MKATHRKEIRISLARTVLAAAALVLGRFEFSGWLALVAFSQSRFHRLGFRTRCTLLLITVAMTTWSGEATEIQWTRMAGQWPVESSPLVADFRQSGTVEILVLNRGGQLMLWTSDGTAVGSGQDGLVAQLPPGRWTTTPILVETAGGARLIAANVEGLVVGLDQEFRLLWQHKLPGEIFVENNRQQF